jgi:DNA invertase Pin-like site-specific DNA recombinase
MANGKFIAYYRVSTSKQGKSGLGLEAQQTAVMHYLNGGQWTLVAEYTEVESGKKSDNRPQLLEALKACKRTGSTLVIAKLDRLSRNTAFITNLMESGVEFVAVDMPTASKFTIHIYAALAEQERDFISQRTKAALQASKERGTKLGTPENLNSAVASKGRVLGVESRVKQADKFAQDLAEIITEYTKQGLSLNAIARQFNADGILTPRGKTGTWTAKAVSNLIKRLNH